MEIELKVKGYRCERCIHEWIPRKKVVPIICPFCKSAYFNIPRKINNGNNKSEHL